MIQRRTIGSAAAIAALALAVSIAPAQNSGNPWDFPDFSATQAYESPRGVPVMKVYLSGSTVRVERNAAIAAIYVHSNSKVYNLTKYPNGAQTCVVMRPDQAGMLPSPLELLFGAKVVRTPAGTEVVEGHKCRIERVVVTRTDGRSNESTVWEAEDLQGVPVKIESQLPEGLKLTAIYRDIVLGKPDQALFTPPAKCTPFEKMWQEAK